MIRANDMGSVFALARYAAEKAKPLVDRIPGGCLGVDVHMDDKWNRRPWSVNIGIHRVIKVEEGADFLAPMVLQAPVLADSGAVDAAVERLRRIVETKSWQLDESEKVAA